MIYPWQTAFWQIAEWLMSQHYPWFIVVAFFTMAYVMARVLTVMIVGAATAAAVAAEDNR